MRRWLSRVLVLLAAVLLIVPLDPAFVERWYSTGLYRLFQRHVTRVSSSVPFALFDVILVATALVVGGIVVAGIRRARRGPLLAAMGTTGMRILTVGAVLYLWFLVVWGFNYRRVPLVDRLDVQAQPVTAAAVSALGDRTVGQLNALHGLAHAEGWRDPFLDSSLRAGYTSAQQALGGGGAAWPAPLKPSLLGPYFRWTSVDGMIDPFALEVLGNPDLLPMERPFVAAHEWAHLAGYADESEASFVGFLTCMQAGVSARYSAWLFLYYEIASQLQPAERDAIAAALAAGPRADLTAIAERVRSGQLPTLRRASWVAYDRYLKANRVTAGVRSYDAVVTLLVRTRFEPEWRPVLAGAATP
jgi:hypothetical protein